MKRIVLPLVAIFEIVCGLWGFVLIVRAIRGGLPFAVVSVLWYGVFPLISLLAGVSLLLRWKYAFTLSVIVLLLQIPFINTNQFMLNLGLPVSLTVTGVWNSRGANPLVLGINFLALLVLILMLTMRSAFDRK